MQRKIAIVFSPLRIVASQTCVVRPPWTSVATQSSDPSRAVPRKFAFSSIVVKPVPPAGSDAMHP
ncbi:MAG TPA: hypothetical protein VE736_02600 [Gaiellaceae bacterium]|nr:hypothetical protein [Gaiellaceae bacterium]